jgi:hypothetical protein
LTLALLLGLFRPALSAEGEEPGSPPEAVAPCPFLDSDRDIRANLLFGRVAVDLDPVGGELVNGIDLVGSDPHLLVPRESWREIVRWVAPTGMAVLFADDPQLEAPEDLQADAVLSMRMRVGDEAAAGAGPVDVAFREPGVRGLVLAAPYDEQTWAAAGVAVLPDGTLLRVGAFLLGDIASDETCRAAALARLGTLGAGPRPRDAGGEVATLPITIGGAMNIPVPHGYAPMAWAGFERSVTEVLRWAPSGAEDTRPALRFTVSHLGWPEIPKRRGKEVDRGTILGVHATWTRAIGRDHFEETWITGMWGDDWKGEICVQVRAPTAEERATLRKLAEEVTFTSREDLEKDGDAEPPPLEAIHSTLPDSRPEPEE